MRLFVWLILATLLWGVELQDVKRPTGIYYFTPALGNEEFTAFGYVSKVRPTREEVEEQKRELEAIIEGGIKREYGSWENYRKQMEKVGKEAAKEAKSAPEWAKVLMPPAVVQKAVPLLLEGALRYAISHPEAAAEPVGNVGECGILLFQGESYKKIPLGINMPVVWMSYAPNGKFLAILSDASVQKRGRYVTMGKIDILELAKARVVKSYLLANVVDQLEFTPDGKRIAFLVQNPKKWSQKVMRFIEVGSWKISKDIVALGKVQSEDSFRYHFGKNHANRGFVFSADGKLVCVRKYGSFGCYDLKSAKQQLFVKGGGDSIDASPDEMKLIDAFGRMWDLQSKKMLWHYDKYKKGWAFTQVRFLPHTKGVILQKWVLGKLVHVDMQGQEVAQTPPKITNSRRFFLRNGYVFSFARDRSANLVDFHGSLRREKMLLRVLDAKSLEPIGSVRFRKGSVIDAAVSGNYLYVSNFDSISIFRLR